MRIISGTYRGRAINPPRNLRARPTTDFAKENLFNVLGNIIDYEDTDVLDLFAGTGSISYEFASRGARSVTSVEINAVHYNFIRQTARELGATNIYPIKANAFEQLCRRAVAAYIYIGIGAEPCRLQKLQGVEQHIVSRFYPYSLGKAQGVVEQTEICHAVSHPD